MPQEAGYCCREFCRVRHLLRTCRGLGGWFRVKDEAAYTCAVRSILDIEAEAWQDHYAAMPGEESSPGLIVLTVYVISYSYNLFHIHKLSLMTMEEMVRYRFNALSHMGFLQIVLLHCINLSN